MDASSRTFCQTFQWGLWEIRNAGVIKWEENGYPRRKAPGYPFHSVQLCCDNTFANPVHHLPAQVRGKLWPGQLGDRKQTMSNSLLGWSCLKGLRMANQAVLRGGGEKFRFLHPHHSSSGGVDGGLAANAIFHFQMQGFSTWVFSSPMCSFAMGVGGWPSFGTHRHASVGVAMSIFCRLISIFSFQQVKEAAAQMLSNRCLS